MIENISSDKSSLNIKDDRSELSVMDSLRHYFSVFRYNRGHNPDGSPLDLEILLIFKLISTFSDPKQILHDIGIIIIGDQIAINAQYLTSFLSTCRSRINNSLNNLGFKKLDISNEKKLQMLDNSNFNMKEARFWTLRQIPQSSMVYGFIQQNPHLSTQVNENNATVMPYLSVDGTENDFKKVDSNNTNESNTF